MRTHFVSRLFGALFIEYHTARRAAPPFYAHQSRAGEHLFWLRRLHVIPPPAPLVFRGPSAASAPSPLSSRPPAGPDPAPGGFPPPPHPPAARPPGTRRAG